MEVRRAVRFTRTKVSLEYWCGAEMETSGEIIESESDLQAECGDCGRGYVMTPTQYSKSTVD